MRKKVIVELDGANMLYSLDGIFLCNLQGQVGQVEESKNVVLELIRQGVTPDEIIKLKNNELL